MQKEESALRSSMAKKMRELGAQVVPIESGGTGDGIPDMFVQLVNGADAWIECKIGEVIRGKMVIHFRPGQLAFASDIEKRHGLSILVVECKTDGMLYVFRRPLMFDKYDWPIERFNLRLNGVSAATMSALMEWIKVNREILSDP